MSSQPLALWNAAGLRRTCLVVLLFVAIDAAFLPTVAANTASPPAAVASQGPTMVFAATGLGRVVSFLEGTLSDRRRMVQLAALGMCIGLYILMRK